MSPMSIVKKIQAALMIRAIYVCIHNESGEEVRLLPAAVFTKIIADSIFTSYSFS